MSDDRYIVASITGWAIDPATSTRAGNGAAATSYSVLDTVDCYREVGKFYAAKNQYSYALKRKAEALCAELNELDREHEEQLRMTDGRVYTIEDEIDSLKVEIRQAKWKLSTIERAPREGRWCNSVIAWIDAVANQKQRIVVLERELAGLIADQIAEAEGHAS